MIYIEIVNVGFALFSKYVSISDIHQTIHDLTTRGCKSGGKDSEPRRGAAYHEV